jgi:hypothetical protein
MPHPSPEPSPHPRPTAGPQPHPERTGYPTINPTPEPSPQPQPTPVSPPAHQNTARRSGHPTAGATPNPHPTVTIGPNPVDWNYSAIDPAQMDAFEKALARAQDTLGTAEIQIRQALEKLDLDTSPLTALRETQTWIGSKRPELRRRNETIQAVRETWSPGSGQATGLTPFDEGLYTRAGHNPDAYAAAHALNQAAQTGKLDDTTLAQLEKRTDDADFATALMYALGAAQFRKLLTKTGESTDRTTAQRLQAALGKTLATASPAPHHHLARGTNGRRLRRPALLALPRPHARHIRRRLPGRRSQKDRSREPSPGPRPPARCPHRPIPRP